MIKYLDQHPIVNDFFFSIYLPKWFSIFLIKCLHNLFDLHLEFFMLKNTSEKPKYKII
jgi:hypothetical protein